MASHPGPSRGLSASRGFPRREALEHPVHVVQLREPRLQLLRGLPGEGEHGIRQIRSPLTYAGVSEVAGHELREPSDGRPEPLGVREEVLARADVIELVQRDELHPKRVDRVGGVPEEDSLVQGGGDGDQPVGPPSPRHAVAGLGPGDLAAVARRTGPPRGSAGSGTTRTSGRAPSRQVSREAPAVTRPSELWPPPERERRRDPRARRRGPPERTFAASRESERAPSRFTSSPRWPGPRSAPRTARGPRR